MEAEDSQSLQQLMAHLVKQGEAQKEFQERLLEEMHQINRSLQSLKTRLSMGGDL